MDNPDDEPPLLDTHVDENVGVKPAECGVLCLRQSPEKVKEDAEDGDDKPATPEKKERRRKVGKQASPKKRNDRKKPSPSKKSKARIEEG